MDALDFHPAQAPERPRTLSVLALIALAAGVFSYLWAYCLTDALVAAEVLAPINRLNDPRPRWFATSWFAMMIVFMLVGFFLQRVSVRQMRSLDAMEEAEEQ